MLQEEAGTDVEAVSGEDIGVVYEGVISAFEGVVRRIEGGAGIECDVKLAADEPGLLFGQRSMSRADDAREQVEGRGVDVAGHAGADEAGLWMQVGTDAVELIF